MKNSLRKKAGYFQSSRTLAFGLIAMLPLLLGYEYLTLRASQEHMLQVRNGADVILRTMLQMVGIHSPFYLGIGLLVIIGAAVVLRRRGTRLELSYFFYAVVESVIYALLLAYVLTAVTDRLMLLLAVRRSFHADLMLALGAGVYEELVFRLFLYAGTALILTNFWRKDPRLIYFGCAVFSSIIFSAAHYMGIEAFAMVHGGLSLFCRYYFFALFFTFADWASQSGPMPSMTFF